MLGHVSRCGHYVRYMVIVRSDRSYGRRDSRWHIGLAILDKTGRCSHRIYGRLSVHVCSMQDVRSTISTMAIVQQSHLRSKRTGRWRWRYRWSRWWEIRGFVQWRRKRVGLKQMTFSRTMYTKTDFFSRALTCHFNLRY